MRALAIVAIVALGPSVIEARAADLRVDGPAIRGPDTSMSKCRFVAWSLLWLLRPSLRADRLPLLRADRLPLYRPIPCLLARLSPLPNDADQNTGRMLASGYALHLIGPLRAAFLNAHTDTDTTPDSIPKPVNSAPSGLPA